jgi:hypothetical protein
LAAKPTTVDYDNEHPGGGYDVKSSMEWNKSQFSQSVVVFDFRDMLQLFRILNSECHAMRKKVIAWSHDDSPVPTAGGSATYKKYWQLVLNSKEKMWLGRLHKRLLNEHPLLSACDEYYLQENAVRDFVRHVIKSVADNPDLQGLY